MSVCRERPSPHHTLARTCSLLAQTDGRLSRIIVCSNTLVHLCGGVAERSFIHDSRRTTNTNIT